MTESEARAAADLGLQAQLLLDNPAYAEAWKRLRAYIVDQWSATNPGDVERAQLLHLQMKLVDRLQEFMTSMVKAGEMAQVDLDRIAQRLAQEQAMREAQTENYLTRGISRLRRVVS